MAEVLLGNGGPSRTDQFDRWREHMANTACPMELNSDHTDDYRAEMRRFRFGGTSVWSAVMPASRLRRATAEIRKYDPEACHLMFPLQGKNHIVHAGRSAVFHPYDIYVGDSSRPVDIRLLSDSEPTRMVGLDVPKTMLPVSPDALHRLLARPLPGQEGFGALLTAFLTRLLPESTAYQPSDGPRLEIVLVDLLTALLAHHIDTDGLSPAESHPHAVLLRIKAFARQRLHDPELTPPVIAAAHQISVSYLHRLFQAEGISVAAWIRRQRLEGTRRDLGDPALRHWPAHRVATRWGFTSYPHFSRAFLAAYGVPPSEYRRSRLPEDGRGPRPVPHR